MSEHLKSDEAAALARAEAAERGDTYSEAVFSAHGTSDVSLLASRLSAERQAHAVTAKERDEARERVAVEYERGYEIAAEYRSAQTDWADRNTALVASLDALAARLAAAESVAQAVRELVACFDREPRPEEVDGGWTQEECNAAAEVRAALAAFDAAREARRG